MVNATDIKEIIQGHKGTVAMLVLGIVFLITAALMTIAKWILFAGGLILMVIAGVKLYQAAKKKAQELKDKLQKK